MRSKAHRRPIPQLLGSIVALALLLIAVAHADVERLPRADAPAAGLLLVASQNLHDPNFAETIVVITEHGILGSIGLIVNRVSALPVVATLPELKGLENKEARLHLGGPLQIPSIRLLVQSPVAVSGATRLFGNVYFVNSTSLLRSLLNDSGPNRPQQIHYYAGYAGWSPGQLQSEIARGDWHLIRGDADAVFAEDGQDSWRELIEKLAGLWVRRENSELGPLIGANVTTVTERNGVSRRLAP